MINKHFLIQDYDKRGNEASMNMLLVLNQMIANDKDPQESNLTNDAYAELIETLLNQFIVSIIEAHENVSE